MKPTLSLLLLLAVPARLVAQAVAPAPAVKPPRVEAEIVLDGVLDEPVWRQAARLDHFYQTRPVDGRPAEDSTVVLVWYSPTAIHFGILAYDRDPGSVRATLAKRDNIASDDQVSVYLDTFNDRRRAYFFGSNAYGVQDDGVRSEGGFAASAGMISGTIDRNPDFLWQSKGQRTSFGYAIEMRIPFKSLRYAGGAQQTWGINIARTTQRTGYEDTWTDVRRASASFLGQAGTLEGIHDIKRGVVTEIQPTITANLPGVRDANGNFNRGDLKTDVGGNLR
ncbi:MAG: carbohydrate binding family 9 domain-containing protein, partial [Gemmatimonadales bacterium]